MMKRSIVLLGGPDTGKTNYIGRLWPSFKKRKGVLRTEQLPDDIVYVDGAVEHLMQGKFAPRSDRNLEVGRADFSIKVRGSNGQGELTELMVPDISGELWTRTVATSEISQEWLNILNQAEGAVIFLRVLSDQIIKPLDWVTARNILKMEVADNHRATEENPNDAFKPDTVTEETRPEAQPSTLVEDGSNQNRESGTHTSEPDLPTQVLLCELLRYLDICLANRSDGARPHVAVVVAAWDLLDPEARAKGPMAYLKREFPLFAGRLAYTGRLDVRLFGLSIVGGDLQDDKEFRDKYLECDISEQGWVIVEDASGIKTDPDVMLPIAWALGD